MIINSTKAYGKTTSWKAKAPSHGVMAEVIPAIIRMTKSTDLEFISGRTVEGLMDNGKMVDSMARGSTLPKTG